MSIDPSFVDISFPVQGITFPFYHEYELFSAISRIIPSIHQNSTWGIHSISGKYHNELINITSCSRLKLRIAADINYTKIPLE
jgi:CRISPR-associated protein Cas6